MKLKLFILYIAINSQLINCDIYGPKQYQCSVNYNQRALAQTLNGPLPINQTNMDIWTINVNNDLFLIKTVINLP